MSIRVVITGGAGFIGSHVTDYFVKNGYEVLVIDNLSRGRLENLNKKASFVKADIRDIGAVKKISKDFKPQIVCHLAAQVSVSSSVKDPYNDASVNVYGTIVVTEEFYKAGAEKLIFASSAAVYGNPEKLPVNEESDLHPIAPYGVSKKAAEDYVRIISEKYRRYFSILRLSNVYGPRQVFDGESGVIPAFIQGCMNNKKVNLYGFGKMVRDFVYVEDVARAFFMASSRDGGIFNISSGAGTEISEVFELIKKECDGGEVNPLPSREGEIKSMVLDSTKAFRELGWRPHVSLEVGIERTIEYYFRTRKGDL